MAVPAFVLDAFPDRTFGGNVAGVVLLEFAAPDWWLRGVAAELAAPTTGFVDLPSARTGEAQVRFFTPRQEIDACGHVTVAIATVLVEEGVWTTGPAAVRAGGGRYPLLLDTDETGVRVQVLQRLQHLARWPALPDITPVLGRARPVADLPPVIAGTGLRHLLIAVADVADLAVLPMRAVDIADLSQRLQVDTIGVFSVAGTSDRTLEVRMRYLCAGIGATEESASGTTTGALAFTLAAAGLLRPDRPTLRMLMGVEMHRPSRLHVEMDFDPDHPERAVLARLHGYATRMLSGTIETAY